MGLFKKYKHFLYGLWYDLVRYRDEIVKTNLLKRIFIDQHITLGKLFLEDKRVIMRLVNVLRLQENDKIVVFNSEGKEWYANIAEVQKRRILLDIISFLEHKENNVSIEIAFSPIKQERMRFLLEKCTEIGATKFTPIIFDRTIVRNSSTEKLEQYIVGACEQSRRVSLPNLSKEIKLSDFLEKNRESEIIFCNEKESEFLINKVKGKKGQIILIGPEGGMTDQERELLLSTSNVQSVSLGNNILRAETAAIFAISYLAALQGFK